MKLSRAEIEEGMQTPEGTEAMLLAFDQTGSDVDRTHIAEGIGKAVRNGNMEAGRAWIFLQQAAIHPTPLVREGALMAMNALAEGGCWDGVPGGTGGLISWAEQRLAQEHPLLIADLQELIQTSLQAQGGAP